MNNYSAINVLAASPLLDISIYGFQQTMIFHLGPSLFQGYMQNQTETNRFEGSPEGRHTHLPEECMASPFFGAQMLSPTGHAKVNPNPSLPASKFNSACLCLP